MSISIIVPVLNEAETLAAFLQHLQPLRAGGHQLIVVDGGSSDQSVALAEQFSDITLTSAAGRARQMNAGAAQALGDWLLFLHADTRLAEPMAVWLAQMRSSKRRWGRFNVRLSGRQWPFRLIETCMNWRSALTGVATGDQAIFVRRELFEQLGGFANIALMEDIDLCRRLRQISAPLCLKQSVLTSSRRWQEKGILRTILLMWQLRLRYLFGASPERLEQRYNRSRRVTTNNDQQSRATTNMKFPAARIVQFAKVPKAGHVKTRLIPALGAEGALNLHKKLLSHTWQTLTATQLAPVQLWADSAEPSGFFAALTPPVEAHYVQQGGDLGERMAQAIEQALLDSEAVVVVGSDCPLLGVDYLNAAFDSLQQGADVVLGPASDGGYVLIGMRKLYRQLFESIDWGSDQVLSQTRVRLQALNCHWHELPERWDVDRPEDLPRLAELGLF